MADQMPDTVTIGEAAALLGVHRNTVRNRIKVGRYTAHKVVTPQGETYAIERDSLGATPDNQAHNPSQTTVHHNPSNSYQGAEIADIGPQAQSLALVQRLLAPFVEELGTTKLELGRTQVERDHERAARQAIERERDELRAEVQLLREIERVHDSHEDTEPFTPVSPSAPSGREQPTHGVESREHEPSHVSAWLRRVFGRS